MTCACFKKVLEGEYKVFALGYYGECWGSKDEGGLDGLLKSAKTSTSNDCLGHHFGECQNSNDNNHCVGQTNSVYVYSLPNKAPERKHKVILLKGIIEKF